VILNGGALDAEVDRRIASTPKELEALQMSVVFDDCHAHTIFFPAAN